MSANLIQGKYAHWRYTIVEQKYSKELRLHLSWSYPHDIPPQKVSFAIEEAKGLIDKLNLALGHLSRTEEVADATDKERIE
jgi:hypothetical protein